MGAKDWMVFYAERDVPSFLRERPTIDRHRPAPASVARLSVEVAALELNVSACGAGHALW
jgi:hypothetical protein